MTYGNEEFVPILLGTGVDAYNIARSLHEEFGVRSLALGRVALQGDARTRASSTCARSSDFDEPGRDRAAFCNALADEFPGTNAAALATVEYYVNVLIDHRDELGRALRHPARRPRARRPAHQQDRLLRDVRGARAAPPAHRRPHARRDGATRASARTLPFAYPVILKPSNTDVYPRLSFEGKQKVYLLDDAAAVRDVAERIFAAGYHDDLIVQEYIEGDESVMRVANTYSDRNGRMRVRVRWPGGARRPRPLMVGNNNAILSVDAPDSPRRSARSSTRWATWARANFDVMFDRRDGVCKVLELNLRQGATCYYAMAAGGNIVECFVDDWIREVEPRVHASTTDERLWLNLPYSARRWSTRRSRSGSRVRGGAQGGLSTRSGTGRTCARPHHHVLRIDLATRSVTIKYAAARDERLSSAREREVRRAISIARSGVTSVGRLTMRAMTSSVTAWARRPARSCMSAGSATPGKSAGRYQRSA